MTRDTIRQPLTGLYAITDSHLMPDTDTLCRRVEAALQGGASLVQYRDKSSDSEQRLQQARLLRELCHRHGARLLINDDVELAIAAGADGVHLGQEDSSLAAARERLGEQATIGITCHDRLDLARTAVAGGADYVAFGAFFPSSTKPKATQAPIELLHLARTELGCPIVAIGGISVDNAGQLIEAGANMIAVVHALFAHDDIRDRASAFSALFQDSLV